MEPIIILYVFILIVLSFIPAFFYVRWFRNLEKYSREPYSMIFGTFFWGAILAIFFALLIEYAVYNILTYEYIKPEDVQLSVFIILALIVAPIAEEFVKPLGILFIARKETDEVEDGMIYGAACGFGFAATENLIYGFSALGLEGIEQASMMIAVRTISSTLLHASATAITGYGIGLWLVKNKPFGSVVPYFFIAVILHAVFNAMAMTNTLLGLLFAIIIAIVAIEFVKNKIMALDVRSADRQLLRLMKKR